MKNHYGSLKALIICLTCCIHLQAQDSLKIGMKSKAREYFAQKEYVQALPLYRELLNFFPKEPEYQYCTGVCLVGVNQEPEEAIRLLRSVSMADYEPLSLYYLGKALHLYYSFEDAIKAYSKFLLKGKSADIKYYDVERLIEMAKNGLEYTRTGYPVKVQSTQTIHIEQLPLAAGINSSGKLMKKPIEFCNKTDQKTDYRPWMFLPAYTEINEYVFVAGYEKGRKNQKQLFRIRNINHESWGFTEPLNEVINSPYDEEYPYFDTKSSVLYFSSKGHSSMGGYDIFKATYDWNTKTWQKPENLGFPINSPYDDFVFITDDFNRSASFVSTRNAGPNQATIYRIRLDQDTTGLRFVSVDDIRKASQLQTEPVKTYSEEITGASASPATEVIDGLDNTVVPPLVIPVKSNYNILLANALQLQIKADSLARLTRELRIAAKEASNDDNKKQLVEDIIRTDKEAKRYQREADYQFAEARKLKENDGQYANPADSVVTLAKEVSGISVYQYSAEPSEELSLSSTAETESAELRSPEEETSNPVRTDEFAILEQSPYSETNPIPQSFSVRDGLVYRIQLGVFSKPKPNDAFGGIHPVCYEQNAGNGMLKYYAGQFYSMNSVNAALEKVRSRGFPDAFIVAFMEGKPISTEKAREIEFAGFRL